MLRDYVLILANTGMRVGELNGLKLRDIHPFKDEEGRDNYRLVVRGKTGERDVIPRVSCKAWLDRVMARRKAEGAVQNDYLFVMPNGRAVFSLGDQFNSVLKAGNIVTNSFDEKFTLYSLRHLYAVQALRKGISVFAVARNMGTSVEVIQRYYGKHATAVTFATALGN
jgi:integrase